MCSPSVTGVVLLLVLGVRAGPPTHEGGDPLQDIWKDVKRIQEDEGLFDKYYQCLVGVGPCNQDAKRLKDVIEEALERNCARCTAAQRRAAVSLLNLAMECRPVQFHELEKRLDPTGSFMGKYKRRRDPREGWGVPIPLEGRSE